MNRASRAGRQSRESSGSLGPNSPAGTTERPQPVREVREDPVDARASRSRAHLRRVVDGEDVDREALRRGPPRPAPASTSARSGWSASAPSAPRALEGARPGSAREIEQADARARARARAAARAPGRRTTRRASRATRPRALDRGEASPPRARRTRPRVPRLSSRLKGMRRAEAVEDLVERRHALAAAGVERADLGEASRPRSRPRRRAPRAPRRGSRRWRRRGCGAGRSRSCRRAARRRARRRAACSRGGAPRRRGARSRGAGAPGSRPRPAARALDGALPAGVERLALAPRRAAARSTRALGGHRASSSVASRQKPTASPASAAAPRAVTSSMRRPPHRHAEHVGLELHQEVVPAGAAVDAQRSRAGARRRRARTRPRRASGTRSTRASRGSGARAWCRA